MKRKTCMIFFFTLLLSMVAFSFNASGANPSALTLKKAIYDADENTLILEGTNIDQVEPLSVTIGSEILTLCLAEQYEACCEVTAQSTISCGLDGTPINGGGTYSVTVQQGQGSQGQGSPGGDSIDVYIPPLPPPVCLPGDFVECYTSNPSEIGVGPCRTGLRYCVNGTWDTDCDGEITPIYEVGCNGTDDDCDGEVDEGFDNDNDGYMLCDGDCDDNDYSINPGATEVCDGKDNDCNQSTVDGFGEAWFGNPCDGTDADQCNEGFMLCVSGSQGCSDTTDNNEEVCNGVDDDCDGEVDEGFDNDSDGVRICDGDCDDSNPNIYPGAVEECNALDDDCSGVIDDGLWRQHGEWEWCQTTSCFPALVCAGTNDACNATCMISVGCVNGEVCYPSVDGYKVRSCDSGSWGSWSTCIPGLPPTP